jgi:hypothetical protein
VGFVLGLAINVVITVCGLGRYRERIAQWLEP